jgi:hypothetical protein
MTSIINHNHHQQIEEIINNNKYQK